MLQYPPWQILKVNETGHVEKYSGLVFEIVNELSNSLNFTYEFLIFTVFLITLNILIT